MQDILRIEAPIDDDEETVPEKSLSFGTWVATFSVIIIPFIGFIGAIIYFWGWGIGWSEIILMLSLYILTVIGITVGFHRLFTHRAFETGPLCQGLFAILGSMAIQGPLLKWVALHRRHHQYSDTGSDPHSPHCSGMGIWGLLRGAWHAHMGWFFTPDPPDLCCYVKDLARSPMLRKIDALFPLWVILSLLIPAIIGGVITQSWKGVLLGFLWGGLARVFLVHHVTWSINSICHIWGSQPYKNRDHSRNNFLFGILALGEGWHNNHHAFPFSARHGFKWWQFDMSYYIIWLLSFFGLARNLRVPNG